MYIVYQLCCCLLCTDPSLHGRLLKLFVDAGDVDFLRLLVSKYSVDVNGESVLLKLILPKRQYSVYHTQVFGIKVVAFVKYTNNSYRGKLQEYMYSMFKIT